MSRATSGPTSPVRGRCPLFDDSVERCDVADSAMTKATQETAAGEGLAVGCLALGVTAVTSARMDVDLSFSRLAGLAVRARLPLVKASLDRVTSR
jgi:hypothetical protein